MHEGKTNLRKAGEVNSCTGAVCKSVLLIGDHRLISKCPGVILCDLISTIDCWWTGNSFLSCLFSVTQRWINSWTIRIALPAERPCKEPSVQWADRIRRTGWSGTMFLSGREEIRWRRLPEQILSISLSCLCILLGWLSGRCSTFTAFHNSPYMGQRWDSEAKKMCPFCWLFSRVSGIVGDSEATADLCIRPKATGCLEQIRYHLVYGRKWIRMCDPDISLHNTGVSWK